LFVDDDGLELADLKTAISEARRTLEELVRDSLRTDGDDAVSLAIRDGADASVVLWVSIITTHPDDAPQGGRKTSSLLPSGARIIPTVKPDHVQRLVGILPVDSGDQVLARPASNNLGPEKMSGCGLGRGSRDHSLLVLDFWIAQINDAVLMHAGDSCRN
jgi:hypothetical protein